MPPEAEKTPIAVLISGRGSNLQALIDAGADPGYPARIAVVISNLDGVYGLVRAQRAGIPTWVVPHKKDGKNRPRAEFDAELAEVVERYGCQWVCLAGFMRVLSTVFLDRFEGRVLNIHPSLLPAFPGLHAQKQALEAGVSESGVTVHFVDAGIDSGKIIGQTRVPVLPGDTEETLSARILAAEHPLYVRCLAEVIASTPARTSP